MKVLRSRISLGLKDGGFGKACLKDQSMSMRQLMLYIHDENLTNFKEIGKNHKELMLAHKATSVKGANDVVTVRANRKETMLHDFEMRLAVCQRLGVLDLLFDFENDSGNKPCKACASQGKISGNHLLNCAHSRKERHDDVLAQHHKVLNDAGIRAVVEKRTGIGSKKIDL